MMGFTSLIHPSSETFCMSFRAIFAPIVIAFIVEKPLKFIKAPPEQVILFPCAYTSLGYSFDRVAGNLSPHYKTL
jgi:hypothetical protein